MKYVELHAASAFSFLHGASVPEELAELCAHYDMGAMALIDLNGFYGSPRFHVAATKAKVKAHIGAEIEHSALSSQHSAKARTFRRESTRMNADFKSEIKNQKSEIENRRAASGTRHSPNTPVTSIVPLLCANRDGYRNLCELITKMKLRVPKYGETVADAAELEQHAGGLICLTGDERGPLAQALARGGRSNGKLEAKRELERLIGIFGHENVYVELQRHYQREEEARNRVAIELARELHLPLLASNGVRYAQEHEREVLDVFTCIHNHCTLETAGRLLSLNSERRLKTPEEMAELFADLLEAIANTEELSSRLEFTLDKLGYEFPRYPVCDGETMMSFLRKRTDEGARQRYLHPSKIHLWPRAQRQIERELALIEKLQLEGYFLIVWDIVRHCREYNILVQGRGSAANSAVCYSLGITAVDAVGMDLLFERFLSEERGEWPDIDLDLPSGDQRERAIQYVYQRYGELGAAMTANVITYRGRSAAREMGKVLGFDEESTARLSAMVGSWEYKDPSDTLERQFRDAGFDLRHPRIHKFFELCLRVQDLPRHLGQHSGGMVICQGQLNSVVPLEPATMPGRTVVQWDKDDCADMGIIKVDLLGLGMMAVLEETIEIIQRDYGDEVSLAHLPPEDPQVYGALQKADTVGMFQIESRAQMSCLPRLHPTRFYDIVVQVAIIRPGPIVGKMVHPYLKRRQGKEPVVYPHPSLEPVLERTLGVPLFQEQLLRMAMIAAGFTGGEAEELRRAFGFKRSEKRMKDIEVKLRAGMDRNGIAPAAQEEIVRSMMAFALYGFPESHSASFALLAYASAYLKTHYLPAFTAALLNNQPMGFYHPSTIVKDAQRHGLKILPIDVMKSEWGCTIEREQSVSGIPHSAKPNHGFALIHTEERQRHRTIASDEDVLCVAGGDLTFTIKGSGGPGTNPSRAEAHLVTTYNGTAEAVPLPTIAGADFQSEFGNQNSEIESLAKGESAQFVMRLGLRYVKGLREEAARALIAQRTMRPFASVDDLARRVPELRKNELVALAEIGALNGIQHSTSGIRHAEQRSGFSTQQSEKANHRSARIHTNAEETLRALMRIAADHWTQIERPSCDNELRELSDLPTAADLGFKSMNVARRSEPRAVFQSEFANQKSEVENSKSPHIDTPVLKSTINNHQSKIESPVSPRLSGQGGRSHRRDALWQVERAARRPGPLLDNDGAQTDEIFAAAEDTSPLEPMTRDERLVADFANTGLTIGPHPMAYRRPEMNKLRVHKATELPVLQNGRKVRAAGCVIARQRPGTASGFVFLSIEDETGIANVIITPQLFEQNRMAITGEQFLLVEGVLQHQEGVVSIRAERVAPLPSISLDTHSHDFH